MKPVPVKPKELISYAYRMREINIEPLLNCMFVIM